MPWPAWAKRPALPVIGYLSGASRAESEDGQVAFRRGLAQTGYVDGRNVAIETRWADGDYGRLKAMAAELARRPVDLLVATGGPRAAQAALEASATLPIVFIHGGDPVKLGLVQSMNRPGGNATDVSFLTAKLLPKGSAVLDLIDLTPFPAVTQAVQDAGRQLGLVPHAAYASTPAEVELAFARAQALRVAGVNVLASPFLHGVRAMIMQLAQRARMPAIYQWPETAREGGLMGYGPSSVAMLRQLAGYAARILRGAKPADLPIEQPTKVELVINLKTARAIGVEMPRALLLRADEVIQ